MTKCEKREGVKIGGRPVTYFLNGPKDISCSDEVTFSRHVSVMSFQGVVDVMWAVSL